jgi:hypothetical protein
MIKFFSISWTSGSLKVRPARRFKLTMVFLALLISWVLAPSPRYLCLGPKEAMELNRISQYFKFSYTTLYTYGVARLETSLQITSIPRLRATAITAWRLPRSIP